MCIHIYTYIYACKALFQYCLIWFTNVNFQIRHPPTLSPGRVYKLPNHAFSSTQPPSCNHRFFLQNCQSNPTVSMVYIYIYIYIYTYIYIYESRPHSTCLFWVMSLWHRMTLLSLQHDTTWLSTTWRHLTLWSLQRDTPLFWVDHQVTLLSDCYLTPHYGVATISRLLKIIGLFCKRAL